MNDQNNQTQHNHPPRCCCHYSAEAITSDDVTVCPMCIEHGELARLAEWKPEYPGQPEPQCPSCHTVAGHPCTDYCRASNPKTPHHQQQADHDPEHICDDRCSWPTHPVGPRSQPGAHHAEDCPMRHGLVTTGCICGREGERDKP